MKLYSSYRMDIHMAEECANNNGARFLHYLVIRRIIVDELLQHRMSKDDSGELRVFDEYLISEQFDWLFVDVDMIPKNQRLPFRLDPVSPDNDRKFQWSDREVPDEMMAPAMSPSHTWIWGCINHFDFQAMFNTDFEDIVQFYASTPKQDMDLVYDGTEGLPDCWYESHDPVVHFLTANEDLVFYPSGFAEQQLAFASKKQETPPAKHPRKRKLGTSNQYIDVVQPHLNTLRIRETSHSPDKAVTEHPVSFSPDCTVYAQEHENITETNSTISDLYVEIKSKPDDDAFLTNISAGEISVSSPNPFYRTHVFSAFIVGSYARLIRWDRSGAIVTAPINYRQDPQLLDFFTCYDEADRWVRGHDDSVRKASPEETLKAVCADERFRIDRELLVVTVPLQGCKSSCDEYVIRPPVARPYTPPGRATRTSIAYDLRRNRVAFFKDSWRVDCEGILKEDHDARMVLLKNHDIITNLIHEAIQNEPWPTTEPAEKQEFVLSRVEKQSLRSSFERCREAATEREGGEVTEANQVPLIPISFRFETIDTMCTFYVLMLAAQSTHEP
ncbi:hypothetical protein EV363DRAFT_1405624 [Boletus edulis]|nr:hypothetical protein EV363DRAFT_1405624 [Boletus edulis]